MAAAQEHGEIIVTFESADGSSAATPLRMRTERLGYAAPAMTQTWILKHVSASIKPLLDSTSGSIFAMVDWTQLLTVVGMLCVLIYFFFSVEHKGVLKPISYTGVIYLMIYFGASFAYTMMGRFSLLIERINFLINDWLLPLFGKG